jgi:hypothetical protein
MPDRILFLGEGPRDVGGPSKTRRAVPCDFEGDVPRAVRRLALHLGLEERFGYEASTFRHVIAQMTTREGRPMRVGGKAKELRDAVVYSLVSGRPRAIVAVVDARLPELPDLRRDADDIVLQCREQTATVPVAIGIAVHEIEAWMLADTEARRAAFGPLGLAPLRETDPELIPDAKAAWHSYAGQCATPHGVAPLHHADSQRKAAWESMRVHVVCTACPRGFQPFVEAVEPLLAAVLGRR